MRKCHLGPGPSSDEVWQESKHGCSAITKATQPTNAQDEPAGGQWLPGRDYFGPARPAPVATISATPSQKVTHDVGARISWTLRPAISTNNPIGKRKRNSMEDVCAQCHGH